MFISIFITVLIVSSISAGLAAILVLCQLFVANYGTCKISINREKELSIKGGESLLSSLNAQKIFIPSACGGRGTCGLCKLRVLEGAGLLLPTEEPYLNPEERKNQVRLSCQVKVRNDLQIEIPPELFAIREYTCRCVDILDLTHDIKQFRLELQEPATLNYIPGQYVQLYTPPYAKQKEEVYRAYSISADPAQKNIIELIIRLVPNGICTTWCFQYLKAGDPVKFHGPFGEFHLSQTDKPILFIAGGSGMAPIKCMLHHMKNTQNQRQATYFFGANKVSELFLTDQMREFESTLPHFRFIPVVAMPEEGQNWQGQIGLVTDAVRREVKNAADCEAYLCGSPGMIDAAIQVLKDLGMNQKQIYFDKFG